MAPPGVKQNCTFRITNPTMCDEKLTAEAEIFTFFIIIYVFYAFGM